VKRVVLKFAVRGKAIPVTICGGLEGCEMLRIPLCVENRLIDGGKVVSPTITILGFPIVLSFI
jgi:hypothetical protein